MMKRFLCPNFLCCGRKHVEEEGNTAEVLRTAERKNIVRASNLMLASRSNPNPSPTVIGGKDCFHFQENEDVFSPRTATPSWTVEDPSHTEENIEIETSTKANPAQAACHSKALVLPVMDATFRCTSSSEQPFSPTSQSNQNFEDPQLSPKNNFADEFTPSNPFRRNSCDTAQSHPPTPVPVEDDIKNATKDTATDNKDATDTGTNDTSDATKTAALDASVVVTSL